MIAAIYARASTGKQGDTIEHQVSLIKEWGERMDENVTFYDEYTFTDEDESGYRKSLLERPAMKNMIRAVDDESVDVVFFKGVSRFARDSGDAIQTAKKLERKGIRVISIMENYDSKVNDPTFFQLHAVLAESESRKTSISVSLGNKEKAKRGLWVSSRTPYGYVRIQDLRDHDLRTQLLSEGRHPQRLYPLPDESEAVKLMFELFTENGFDRGEIRDRMIELGITNRAGTSFSLPHIKDILTNPVHVGEIHYGKTKNELVEGPNGTTITRSVPVEESKHVIATKAHPPIVTHETFNKALAIYRGRKGSMKSKRENNSNNARHPLTGILKCGSCGSPMICQIRRYKKVSGEVQEYRYYVCARVFNHGRVSCPQPNIAAHEIESFVFEQIKEKIMQVDMDSAFENLVTFDPNEEINKNISHINTRIDKLEGRTLALLENIEIYDPSTFRKLNLDIKKEIGELKQKKSDYEKDLKVVENIITKEDIKKELNDFLNIDFENREESRVIMHKWINEIVVKDDEVVIDQRFKFIENT